MYGQGRLGDRCSLHNFGGESMDPLLDFAVGALIILAVFYWTSLR
jgi:hypothetical protein